MHGTELIEANPFPCNSRFADFPNLGEVAVRQPHVHAWDGVGVFGRYVIDIFAKNMRNSRATSHKSLYLVWVRADVGPFGIADDAVCLFGELAGKFMDGDGHRDSWATRNLLGNARLVESAALEGHAPTGTPDLLGDLAVGAVPINS